MDESKKQKFLRILEERTSINSETGCWEWIGPLNDGYGRVMIDGVNYYTHRISAEIFLGLDPRFELDVLHALHCPSKACWNFHHLYIGTQTENNRDMQALGRIRNQYMDRTHCKHGHEYTEANTMWVIAPSGNSSRRCRECIAINNKKRTERRGA